MKYIKTFDNTIEKITKLLLVIVMLLLISLSVYSIILRWFETTFLWIEPLIRHMVFTATFLGGVIAAGTNSHISIDLLGRYLKQSKYKKLSNFVERLVYIIVLFTLVWIVISAYQFVKVELQYGKISFLGIHSGALVSIIPIGFTAIFLRFFNKLLLTFSQDNGINK